MTTLLILAAIFIFVLQVNVMDRLAPEGAYGSYFFGFVVVLFTTLLRESAKSRKERAARPSVSVPSWHIECLGAPRERDDNSYWAKPA